MTESENQFGGPTANPEKIYSDYLYGLDRIPFERGGYDLLAVISTDALRFGETVDVISAVPKREVRTGKNSYHQHGQVHHFVRFRFEGDERDYFLPVSSWSGVQKLTKAEEAALEGFEKPWMFRLAAAKVSASSLKTREELDQDFEWLSVKDTNREQRLVFLLRMLD